MIIRCCLILSAIIVHGTTAAVIRKPPAFATPIYSDAYLPAAMQVIFHVVDQLKRLEAEEVEENLLQTASTSPHPPGQRQPLPTPSSVSENETALEVFETVTVTDEERYYEPPERYQEAALILMKKPGVEDAFYKLGGGSTPDETEVVYALPESEHRSGDADDDDEKPIDLNCGGLKNIGSVEGVVKEIYSIVESSSSSLKEENPESLSTTSSSSSKDSISQAKPECIEGKNSPAIKNLEIFAEGGGEEERLEEQNAEERFTLLGERVDQVPNPSLVAFLRAGNATSNPSLRQLGELYDAFSRDARRQGFSKFAGYSAEVLKSLEGSSGGGANVQLKELLEKVVVNKELTRYDSMEKSKEILAVLKDDGSKLSTDLRILLPLRYVH